MSPSYWSVLSTVEPHLDRTNLGGFAAGFLILALGCAPQTLSAAAPLLSLPARHGTQFQFTLTGKSNEIDYVLSGGVPGALYAAEQLALNSKAMLVQGNVTLYVQNDLVVSGNGSIQIAPGGSLKLYVAGSNASLSGNGIVNNAIYAANFQYYGLPSNTSVTLSGNGSFTGVVYAPDAHLSLNAGGAEIYHFSGATVTKTATVFGNLNFHYDESLERLGPSR
jgi:hypothetical protein